MQAKLVTVRRMIFDAPSFCSAACSAYYLTSEGKQAHFHLNDAEGSWDA